MLSKILKQLLTKRGITVASLARKTGVPKTNIQGWLEGSSPNIEQLDKVAQFLDVEIEYLAFGRERKDSLEQLMEKVHIHTGTYEVTVKKIIKKN